MNIGDSDESRSSAVRSKYFTRNSGMDDSLSDFQEPKNSCTGPKKAVKPKPNKKPRKAPKRPRGQKDIRSALQSTKKELESYSKEFDTVCKKAGIDIDSEELQLAIALSKSLQNTPSTSNESGETSQTHQTTTQERVGKIRTTLQEYGFKVPVVKIAGNTRKIRKHRNNYKLIQTTDIVKKEIIADKYSQVLFHDITHCSLYCSDIDVTSIPLFYLATNVTYDILRLTDTFYVENLIEKSTSTGNLLKDWSEIPGRPESPKQLATLNMNISEIGCSQDELDVVLSGTIKRCKDIVSRKIKDCCNETNHRIDKVEGQIVNVNIDNVTGAIEIDMNNQKQAYIEENKDVHVQCLVESISAANQYRSCSPDMFDDPSDLFDDSKNVTLRKDLDLTNNHREHINASTEIMDLTQMVYEKSPSKQNPNDNLTRRKSDDLMELTECIQFKSQGQTSSQLSQKRNVTKRKSNDFMEITECVATSSQPVQSNIDLTQLPSIIEENSVTEKIVAGNVEELANNVKSVVDNNIDLTNSPEINKENTSSTPHKSSKETVADKSVENMDLTQSSDTSDELPFVSLSAIKDKNLDATIIVDIDEYAHINKRTNLQSEGEIHIDLTQSEPIDNEGTIQSQSFFEEYNHDHSKSTDEAKETHTGRKSKEISEKNIYNDVNLEDVNTSLVETITVESGPLNSPFKSPKVGKINLTIQPENFETSRDSFERKYDNQKLIPNSSNKDVIDDIDLTQESDTEELSQTSKNCSPDNSKIQNYNVNEDSNEDIDLPTIRSSQSCSSYGKKGDVSIDYDEFITSDPNNEVLCIDNNNLEPGLNPESIIYDNTEESNEKRSKNNSILSNCSQNSEVFDLTDKELDYSLHQSKLELPRDNFAFGGISVMDDLSNFGVSKKSIEVNKNLTISHVNGDEVENLALNDRVNVKEIYRCNEISPIKHRRITEIATPQKANCSDMITVTTPKNSELIIKMNNVSPMKDYESMSTPVLHKELDKFGIKPFKRKRAIQLLTHIYNETHPIIESTDELASPPKRHKPNNYLPTSPKNRKTSRKLITSPLKFSEIHKIDKANTAIRNSSETYKENVNKHSQKSVEPFNNAKNAKGKGKGKKSRVTLNQDIIERPESSIENTQSRNKENVDMSTNEGLENKEIECCPKDWVFQKREKAKVHSCRVPLHIAFYNYVRSRRDLREAILCYEPVEIDVIHKDLVGYGHRYDPKDLLKFLDKKCITVKTTDNEARNQKR